MERNTAKARNPACLKIANELIRLAALGMKSTFLVLNLTSGRTKESSPSASFMRPRRRPNLEGQGQTTPPASVPDQAVG